jgi:hypothetical protein
MRRLSICLLLCIPLIAGCIVQSKYNTRSFMTPEEIAAVDKIYAGPQPETPKRTLEPFLKGFEGPAIRVNGLDIQASDIRRLYEYLASYKPDDPIALKRQAAMQWIQTYAVMSHWPDKIEPARQRIEQLRQQAVGGADFRYLIIENSQEPGADRSGGDLGTQGRNKFLPIFEMHAMTDPLNQISEPFPTIFGWHLIEPLERNTDDPNNPTVHVRHLLLVHGLDPANADMISQDNYANVLRWTNLAKVELLAPELNQILPQFVPRTPPPGAEGQGSTQRADITGGQVNQ